MINKYKQYLEDKGTKNFWKKAKQKEYTKDAVDKIYKELTTGFSELTTRNSITLRYLGLVINLGVDRLEISNAGQTFVDSPYKQKIIDEQIMKVYLDCPQLNDNISIKIAPMEILLNILYSVDYFTFDEYKLFICWINDKNEIPAVVELIEAYRKEKNPSQYLEILDQKSQELNIGDFSDNVKRFFDMIIISSYIKKVDDNKIISNLSKKDIEIVLESFSLRDFTETGYFNYLTTNNGWQIYTANPSYIKVIESLESRTTEEQEEIINQITGGLNFPDISKVAPQTIDMEIDTDAGSEIKTKRNFVTPYKIDFELRDSNNRAAGNFAEQIVLKYEKDKLTSTHPDKVAEIKQVSLDDDALGYDILSFNDDLSEKHIEVKAVRNKPALTFRFYISENEVAIAKNDPNYHLYIVFDYLAETPFIYKMPNPFAHVIPGVTIDPIKYLVTVRIKK